ncbi:unnamed protein product [Sphenostylis stenocarpa]|uniref:Uncharacterized protein n=1 Tax=Sphenostylis stenocarpa TaxID=92480 RepID=A0AA86VBR8_9FABA|nr:unnamed protein product [Sphenostylis stenocarpa]
MFDRNRLEIDTNLTFISTYKTILRPSLLPDCGCRTVVELCGAFVASFRLSVILLRIVIDLRHTPVGDEYGTGESRSFSAVELLVSIGAVGGFLLFYVLYLLFSIDFESDKQERLQVVQAGVHDQGLVPFEDDDLNNIINTVGELMLGRTMIMMSNPTPIVPISLGRTLFNSIPRLPITHDIKCNVRYSIKQIRKRRAAVLFGQVWKWCGILVKSSALLSIWVRMIPLLCYVTETGPLILHLTEFACK